MRIRIVVWSLVALLVAVTALIRLQPAPVARVWVKMHGKKTVEDRVSEYGPVARARLREAFSARGVSYPPKRVVMVGLKRERVLQVYAAPGHGRMRLIKSYPILAASGGLGPKLKEGDHQVPEGIYQVTFLNANSAYHLSLRLSYPNDFDQEMAAREGRTDLGGDIMIHGSECSVGCLAMGDPASEDLFVLAADTGIGNIKVILSPVDFRKERWKPAQGTAPEWTPDLYESIRSELKQLPAPI